MVTCLGIFSHSVEDANLLCSKLEESPPVIPLSICWHIKQTTYYFTNTNSLSGTQNSTFFFFYFLSIVSFTLYSLVNITSIHWVLTKCLALRLGEYLSRKWRSLSSLSWLLESLCGEGRLGVQPDLPQTVTWPTNKLYCDIQASLL